ncbi:MAG TPA: FAD-dependent thymidylate synthase [Candidatus Saccharimonadales bacterium]|nr:FAD-dependent thymidylate synthase [Candidatus Saccharimonadales bacterium]
MNTGRGLFIAIEGTDGSGKGTQFQYIADRLVREGYDVATFDFPQYEQPSSYFVRQYLNGHYGSANDVGPYTSSLFYALDRFEAAPKIRESLNAGKVVITNRYVGSSMAHQGTKFQHAQERRGYFIWLDNLEFEMLRVPRPTVSFVLRVPAEVAQRLVDKKQQRSYTTQKRDIHEADLEHLQKAVTVYDDMCELFPRDFIRIDCTRDEKLLAIETVHDILWQKIQPFLPSKRVRKPRSASAELSLPRPSAIAEAMPAPEEVIKTPAHPPSKPATAQLAGVHLAMREISILGAKKLEWSRLASYEELPSYLIAYGQKDKKGRYRYHVPGYFDASIQEQYRAHMDQIFDLYAQMVQSLADYLQRESPAPQDIAPPDWNKGLYLQATEALQGVLPLAATTTVGIYGPEQAIENIIANLLSDSLPEAYETARELLTEARRTHETFMEGIDLASDVTYRTTIKKRLAALAKEQLPKQYADNGPKVQLTDIWPRNEFDLIPDMLYEQSNMSFNEIRIRAAGWPYEQKTKIMEAYFGNRHHRNQRPGSALEKVHYSWDIMSGFDAFRDLQRHHIANTIEWQELTPRYGYDMPKIVEKAELAEQFETCFDLSLRLYSILQSAGYGVEAQYAILLGHKMRWRITYNAREAFYLHELCTGPHNKASVRELVLEMHEQLREKHPVLAEAMKFMSTT